MITYASLRTKMSYKYRQMSKLCIYWRKENFRQQGFVFVGGDSVCSQSKSHCFPDHKIELFLWCHRHRHASMSYVLVRRCIVRELHLIARKLLFSILDTHIWTNLFIIEIGFYALSSITLRIICFSKLFDISIHIYKAQKIYWNFSPLFSLRTASLRFFVFFTIINNVNCSLSKQAVLLKFLILFLTSIFPI